MTKYEVKGNEDTASIAINRKARANVRDIRRALRNDGEVLCLDPLAHLAVLHQAILISDEVKAKIIKQF